MRALSIVVIVFSNLITHSWDNLIFYTLYRKITEPGTYTLVRKGPLHTPEGIAARFITGLAI